MKDFQLAQKYHMMIENYVSGELTALEFEALYLEEFLSEPGGAMSETLYLILEDMFEVVDQFWDQCKPQDETDSIISEPTLYKHAQEILCYLTNYLNEKSIDTTPLRKRVTIWWENVSLPKDEV